MAIIGLIFTVFFTASAANAGCRGGRCESQTLIAQNITLPPPLIAHIQRQFQGRIIGVTPNTSTSGEACREFNKNVVINGKRERAYGTACLQQDGTWNTVNHYDVQVLTPQGRVIIVTVDPASGRIITIRN